MIIRAINTTVVVLSDHLENTQLFCHANGLNSLMEVEERSRGSCGICAARAISTLLCSTPLSHHPLSLDPIIITEFLSLKGFLRLNTLIHNHRDDISGTLLCQLMNCFRYSQHPIIIQSSLVCVCCVDSCIADFCD